MTTVPNRHASALLVIDVQKGVVEHAHGRDAVIANIAALVRKARAEAVSVIWVQHSSKELPRGSPAWQIVPELVPAESEPIVEKRYGDAFEDTTLEQILSSLAVGTLFISGAQTDACIRSTLHGAFVRGYNVTLVGDAHSTDDRTGWGAPPPAQVIAHTNLYWKYQSAPGRTARTIASKDIVFEHLSQGQLDR